MAETQKEKHPRFRALLQEYPAGAAISRPRAHTMRPYKVLSYLNVPFADVFLFGFRRPLAASSLAFWGGSRYNGLI